jgi:hypothetical protein
VSAIEAHIRRRAVIRGKIVEQLRAIPSPLERARSLLHDKSNRRVGHYANHPPKQQPLWS